MARRKRQLGGRLIGMHCPFPEFAFPIWGANKTKREKEAHQNALPNWSVPPLWRTGAQMGPWLWLQFVVPFLTQTHAQIYLVREVYPYPSSSSSGQCVNLRPDCEVFRYMCEHQDYKTYMYQWCRDSCDPQCEGSSPRGRTQTATDHWSRDPQPGDDEAARERRNQNAIRRKYLGDLDYFRSEGTGGQQQLYREQGAGVWSGAYQWRRPYGADDAVGEGARWRDDARWDRNDPRNYERQQLRTRSG